MSNDKNAGVHKKGWLFDWESDAWIRLPKHPNAVIYTDANGYPYIPLAPAQQKITPAEDYSSHTKRTNRAGDWGWYSTTYWTHHDWNDDVLDLVLKYESEFDRIYINTYYCHPPIYGRTWEFRSFDVWDIGGRGVALNPTLGDRVRKRIMDDPEGPKIAWILYKGWMWTPAGGWEIWDPPEDGSDPGHWKHIHVTFF